LNDNHPSPASTDPDPPRARDFRRDIIVLLGTTTGLVIAAFAVYRWLNGHLFMAWLDAGIALAVASPALYAWRTGNSQRAGMVLCVLNSCACLAVCWIVGSLALGWIYLVLLTNFFITERRPALLADLLLIAALWFVPDLFSNGFHAVSVGVTALLTAAFSFVFASRNQDDRVQLQQMASLDALTGVPNRRAMEHMLTRAVAEFHAGQCCYGLVVLDVDRFKEVNDLYGHSAGDAAIADLAAILRFEMRRQDQVFRFGGEEFVALLKLDTRDDLEAATERLRKSVRSALRGPGGLITISLGAAMLLEHDKTWHDWFSRADAALYRAKSGGRDNYVIADDLF
jgi:diguanylate cyclase (GGDEF)-like protein